MKKYFFLFIILIAALAIIHDGLRPSPALASSCTTSNIRWAASSNTLYVSGPVTCTLTEIKLARPAAPLDLIDGANKVWLLKSNLKLENGAILQLHGPVLGGDVNELRLQSLNSSSSTSIIWLRAEWGTFDISHTKIISWNTPANAPDTEYGTYKRSHIRARSYLDSNGITPRESTMNVVNSEIAYLGYNGPEAYGLVWKVIGSSPGLYDKVNVYGDIKDSTIHHNYFGMYSYGAYGMQIINNEVHDNIQYGLDPHDDSDSLRIENNDSHHNGNHGIICSQRCDNLIIRNNRSHHNTGHGIMLHRNTNESLVEDNQTYNNSDTGLVIFDSHNNTVRNNSSTYNKRGLRLSVGSSNNTVSNNKIADNKEYGLYLYKGSDLPTNGDGRPKLNNFIGNTIENNGTYAIYAQEADSNQFEGNILNSNGKGVSLNNAQNNTYTQNSFTNLSVNYFESKNNSDNIVQNSDRASIKMLDTASSMVILDTNNSILKNSKNFATVEAPTQASITQTRALSESVVDYNRLNFTVKPLANEVSVIPGIWGATKDWKATASVAGATANHAVGDLTPNTTYQIKINGSVWNTFSSDENGWLNFSYIFPDTNQKAFTLTPL